MFYCEASADELQPVPDHFLKWHRQTHSFIVYIICGILQNMPNKFKPMLKFATFSPDIFAMKEPTCQ